MLAGNVHNKNRKIDLEKLRAKRTETLWFLETSRVFTFWQMGLQTNAAESFVHLKCPSSVLHYFWSPTCLSKWAAENQNYVTESCQEIAMPAPQQFLLYFKTLLKGRLDCDIFTQRFNLLLNRGLQFCPKVGGENLGWTDSWRKSQEKI